MQIHLYLSNNGKAEKLRAMVETQVRKLALSCAVILVLNEETFAARGV